MKTILKVIKYSALAFGIWFFGGMTYLTAESVWVWFHSTHRAHMIAREAGDLKTMAEAQKAIDAGIRRYPASN